MLCRMSETPLGPVVLIAGEQGLRQLVIGDCKPRYSEMQAECKNDAAVVDELLDETCRQLVDYFRGIRQRFDLSLDLSLQTPFARQVLGALSRVPYGQTISYGELAALAGRPRAARAVGRVMAGNPLPIILPCHRVVGAAGQMVGYSGGQGLATKQWLLNFEKTRS